MDKINKKAECTEKNHPSAARPSSESKTRRFPSLPCGRFGFVGILNPLFLINITDDGGVNEAAVGTGRIFFCLNLMSLMPYPCRQKARSVRSYDDDLRICRELLAHWCDGHGV